MNETVDKETRKHRATKMGRVVSDKMNKTIVVEVERRVQHAEYTRTIKRTSRFHAHDESNSAKVGDRVRRDWARRGALGRRHWAGRVGSGCGSA